MVGALLLSEPEFFLPERWIRPTLVLAGSGLGMLVGSAMEAG